MDYTLLQLIGLGVGGGIVAWAERARLHTWLAAQRGRLMPPHAPMNATPSQQDAADARLPDGRMRAWAWGYVLNHAPQQYPHALVIGATGAGKTTFTTALLASREGRGVVLTAKPDPRDTWGGLPIITIDDTGEYRDLANAFKSLDREARRRLVAAKRRQPIGEPLTVVCDDWPVLASECGDAATNFFKLAARLGRSLNMRLIILTQSDLVKALGLDGEGDTRANFAKVKLLPSREGTISLAGVDHTIPMDLSEVPALAAKANLAARGWREGGADQFLAAQLLMGTGSHGAISGSGTGSERELVPVVPTGSELVPTDTSAVPAGFDEETIRALKLAGWSRNKIAEKLGGRRADALERIRLALGE